MRIIGTGDAILTRRLSGQGSETLDALRATLGQADAAVTNLETPLPAEPLVPGNLPKGMHIASEPFVLDELRWLGFDAVTVANNHAMDYSLTGLVDTLKALSRVGLPAAGAGSTLSLARAPTMVDTPSGRLALIGVTSSNASLGVAADPRGDIGGRPGVSPLRHRVEYVVEPPELEQLLALHDKLGLTRTQRDIVAASRSRMGLAASGDFHQRVTFGEATFVAGPTTRTCTIAHEGDIRAIESSIEQARSQADMVAVSLHAHEGLNEGWNSEEPADFVRTACRRWIKAGANAVLGHGPHRLRGVELYRGRPIFYSLGNFVFMLETVARLPREAYEQQGLDPDHATAADYHDAATIGSDGEPRGFQAKGAFWESVMASIEVTPEGCSIAARPIALSWHVPRSQRGVPALATGDHGEQILARLSALSAPFGTKITIKQDEWSPIATIHG